MYWNLLEEVETLNPAMRPDKVEVYYGNALLTFKGSKHHVRAQAMTMVLSQRGDPHLKHATFGPDCSSVVYSIGDH